MEDQKMYVAATPEEFRNITGCNCSDQDFRKSVIVSGVLGYDKCNGDLRRGYLIFPLSEDVPVAFAGISVRLNDDALWHFLITEEPLDG